MPIKSANAALMSILAMAVFLAGCQEEAAPPAQQKPKVGIVTLQAEPFAVTTELPGVPAPTASPRCDRRSTASSRNACLPKAVT